MRNGDILVPSEVSTDVQVPDDSSRQRPGPARQRLGEDARPAGRENVAGLCGHSGGGQQGDPRHRREVRLRSAEVQRAVAGYYNGVSTMFLPLEDARGRSLETFGHDRNMPRWEYLSGLTKVLPQSSTNHI